jgi:hypothetical protein
MLDIETYHLNKIDSTFSYLIYVKEIKFGKQMVTVLYLSRSGKKTLQDFQTYMYI